MSCCTVYETVFPNILCSLVRLFNVISLDGRGSTQMHAFLIIRFINSNTCLLSKEAGL